MRTWKDREEARARRAAPKYVVREELELRNYYRLGALVSDLTQLHEKYPMAALNWELHDRDPYVEVESVETEEEVQLRLAGEKTRTLLRIAKLEAELSGLKAIDYSPPFASKGRNAEQLVTSDDKGETNED